MAPLPCFHSDQKNKKLNKYNALSLFIGLMNYAIVPGSVGWWRV